RCPHFLKGIDARIRHRPILETGTAAPLAFPNENPRYRSLLVRLRRGLSGSVNQESQRYWIINFFKDAEYEVSVPFIPERKFFKLDDRRVGVAVTCSEREFLIEFPAIAPTTRPLFA